MSKPHHRLEEDISSKTDLHVGEVSACGYVLIVCSVLLLVFTFPFSLLCCLKIVQEYERAVIFRLGRIKASRAQGPGLFFVLPCVDNFVKVDLRTFNFNIAPQEVLTKDSVTVVVDAVIYARIHNATMSVINVANARGSTLLLGATTLRTVLGTAGLSDILSDRERLDGIMKTQLDQATENWGVFVERVEIKDVRLPVQMQRAMAAEAESAREARAKLKIPVAWVPVPVILRDTQYNRDRNPGKTYRFLVTGGQYVISDQSVSFAGKVISAQGEMNAARSLKEAADVLSESPASLQLRYLQTLHTVAEEKNSTIIFPLPMNVGGLFTSAPTAGQTTNF